MIRRTFLLVISVPLAVFAMGPMTEKYIPIGQSPGISGIKSKQGVIIGIQESHIVVENKNERFIVTPTSYSIWIDRSKLKLPNQEGTFKDFAVGSKVEIYIPHWIKIEGLK